MTERKKPTAAELRILRVLWSQGPSSVRDVTAHLSGRDEVGYTTVLKLLQIMAEKGLVVRDETQRPQIYKAAHPRRAMQSRLVRDLIERVFDGSAAELVLRALEARRASDDEIREVQRILNRLEEKKSP
jgi:predicted transcriptional regulator